MRRRTRILIASASILLLVGMAVSQQDNATEAKLRAAMDKETIEGDIKGAIEQYRKLAQGKDRSVAARALVRMAGAYEKLGDSESRRIYETVTREFADQKDALAAAQARLAGKSSGTLTKRLLHGDCARPDGDLSVDARGVVMANLFNGISICDTLTGQLNPILERDDNLAVSTETPVLSPDQRQIVYTWDSAEKDRNPELRIVANQPHSRSSVVVKSSPEYDWFDVDGWFPDGKSVLVTIRNADMTYQLAKAAVDSGQVTPLKSLGWRLRNSRTRPRLSPDGRYITYTALAMNPKAATGPIENEERHIYVFTVNGSTESAVVKTTGINRDPVWSPDGRNILFISDRSGSLGLWSIPVARGSAAGSATLVAPGIGDVQAMGMRQGSYYYAERGEPLESIAIVDVKRQGADTSAALETFAGLAPSWSPDGKWIAFKRHLPGGKSDDYVLVVRSVETGDERMYPTSLGTTGAGTPQWFHDSSSIGTGVARKPHRVDLKTGEFRELRGGGIPSPDDKTVYSVNAGRDGKPDSVVATDVDSGQQRPIFDFPAVVKNVLGGNQGLAIALSPDGRNLAVGWLEIAPTKLHIGRVSVDGSSGFQELYTTDRYYGAGILRWSADGNSILFRKEQPGGASNWGVMKIPAQGGEASLLAHSTVMTGFDASPDGTRVVIGERHPAEHVVALDNVLSKVK